MRYIVNSRLPERPQNGGWHFGACPLASWKFKLFGIGFFRDRARGTPPQSAGGGDAVFVCRRHSKSSGQPFFCGAGRPRDIRYLSPPQQVEWPPLVVQGGLETFTICLQEANREPQNSPSQTAGCGGGAVYI